MFLNDLVQKFFPKDKVFYTLFEQMGENVLIMGNLLNQLVSNTDKDERAKLALEIEDYEHKNDDLTHQIFIELS